MKKLFIICFLISTPLFSMNKPETVDEFIKNQHYYDQKKLYKEKKGDHPLMIVVNNLQKSNKTVQSLVKDFLKTKRKESEKRFRRELNISEEQWKKVSLLCKSAKQIHSGKNKIIFDTTVSNKTKAIIAELNKDFSINNNFVVQTLQNSSGFAQVESECQIIQPADNSLVLVDLKHKLAIHNNNWLALSNEEQTGLFGHEMMHIEKQHSLKSGILQDVLKIAPFKFQIMWHDEEYEADQYAVLKQLKCARGLEAFFMKEIQKEKKLPKEYLAFARITHPPAEKRYQAVKTIRKLLEYEQQWYAGPKGYHKYGEPAYERMWDNYCASANRVETQKKLPEYLLMPL